MKLSPKLETHRIGTGFYASMAGAPFWSFQLWGPCGADLFILASDGRYYGEDNVWEHVSVSTPRRPPNWQEMCFVKDLFWAEDECVVQYHPPVASYINNDPYCLHLWRWRGGEFPMPPAILVGLRDLNFPREKDE